MIRGVLFDLYGTLLVYGDMGKAWSAWIDDVRRSLSVLGLILSEDELRGHCDGFFGRKVGTVPGLVVYESRLHALATGLGGTPTLQWCRDTAQLTMKDWQKEIPADPWALNLLRSLQDRGIRCGVLTNFDYPSHVHQLLELEGFTPFLDCIVISGEEGLKKPDPRIFGLALRRLGLEASATLFVGDHPEQDMLGALNSGLPAVLIQRGTSATERSQMDFHLDSSVAGAEDADRRVSVPVIANLQDLLELDYFKTQSRELP